MSASLRTKTSLAARDDEDDSVSIEEGDIPAEELGKASRPAKDDLAKDKIDGDVAFAESDSDLGSVSSAERSGT